jgi:hypothetical protein
MNKFVCYTWIDVKKRISLVLWVTSWAVAADSQKNIRLESVQGLELVNATAQIETFSGRRAVRLLRLPNRPEDDSLLAIIPGIDFKDGTIEIEVAGSPAKGTDAGNRGFIGLAFRVQDHGARSELFYLRPTNGRSDDQLRRNHTVQYQSSPDFPWSRLRKENPGVYESYADIQPGVWTKMKIEVSGTKARLYVNGAYQPCLLVNYLKLGETHGEIALWAYGGTDAYFSNLIVH